MRVLIFIWLMLLLLNCSRKENQNFKQKQDVVFEVGKSEDKFNLKSNLDESDSRIDLDSLLKIDTNDYMATLVKGELTLSGYNLFHPYVTDLGMFQKKVEEYNLENTTEKVDVFVFESSFIKQYYNNHPKVKHRDLVCGKILSSKIHLNHKIKIGMSKKDILEKIFRPTPLFLSINRIIIYEDDLGEAWTELIFEQGILMQINYDSVYDWIEKELK